MRNVRVFSGAAAMLAVFVSFLASPASAQDCARAMADDCLGGTLTALGYAPVKITHGFYVTVKRGETNIFVQVRLSSDGDKLGLNANMGQIDDDASVTAQQWEALLAANFDVDPSAFIFSRDQKKLYMHRSLDNREMTPERLRQNIESFADDVESTRAIWSPMTK